MQPKETILETLTTTGKRIWSTPTIEKIAVAGGVPPSATESSYAQPSDIGGSSTPSS